jgi:hypothetical protein
LGSSPFARHYSGSRGFFPFLGLLRCFSSPAYRCSPYVFRREHARITTRRFPHSEIPGSKVGQHLPRAYRSHPRPSSALSAKASTACPYSLDRKEHVLLLLWSFQGALRAGGPRKDRLEGRSLKTQQRCVAGAVFAAACQCITSRSTWCFLEKLPRKEVIQPQLPLRLPCYDFTPVTDPTFDGSLPCGLGHRLRVLPASVV